MRDVTDNVTGELYGEMKRGRGRPRKEGALTNAQRQAAYRARRRANVVAEYGVTGAGVTKKPRLVVDQVDAYDECRLEVDALRAELAEVNRVMGKLQRSHAAGLSNESRLRRQLDLAEEERSKAFAVNAALHVELADARDALIEKGSELAAAKRATKSVTGNGNPVSFADMVELLSTFIGASPAVRLARRADEDGVWRRAVVHGGLSESQLDQLIDVVGKKSVTRKAVTKKGV
ncbi:hypothetical protein [Cupriavidus campinensis]